jgi:peptidoglycan/LPS O-acetylase OafA/YrhL
MVVSKRLLELDFLRGIAIILVLFRHQHLFHVTTCMGWIGVDLFFVLSGYLVSGLLFKEYIKYGSINVKNFLIRRGFKIYPVYYIFYLPYIIPIVYRGDFDLNGVLSDLFFLQNVTWWGWGFAMPASWSLAVEEHFYICISLLFYLGIKYKFLNFNPDKKSRFSMSILHVTILVSGTSLLFRIYRNIKFPELTSLNFTMSHLRIDSLMFGVLISYYYYFRYNQLTNFVNKNKGIFIFILIICLIWTPFIEPIDSFFVKTVGFTLVYLGFGLVLLFFISIENITKVLNKILTETIVKLISKIGMYSYSIYIIHSFINFYFPLLLNDFLRSNKYLMFFSTSIISILSGVIISLYIENYFIRLRNKKFPSRLS